MQSVTELTDNLEQDYYTLLYQSYLLYKEESIFDMKEKDFVVLASLFAANMLATHGIMLLNGQSIVRDIEMNRQTYVQSLKTRAHNDLINLLGRDIKGVSDVKTFLKRGNWFKEYGNGMSHFLTTAKFYYEKVTESLIVPKGYVMVKVWNVTPNDNTRHTGTDGQVRKLDEMFQITNDKTGETDEGLYPRAPSISASNGAVCYCTLTYKQIKEEEYLKLRKS